MQLMLIESKSRGIDIDLPAERRRCPDREILGNGGGILVCLSFTNFNLHSTSFGHESLLNYILSIYVSNSSFDFNLPLPALSIANAAISAAPADDPSSALWNVIKSSLSWGQSRISRSACDVLLRKRV